MYRDAIFRASHAGGAVDAGNRRDGCQRLAAKPQRLYAIQIRGICDFAGCMPSESQTDIAGLNAGAVVNHAKITEAAVSDFHGDGGSAGVHAIFHQLFDGGGRTLYHFARGDLTNNVGG